MAKNKKTTKAVAVQEAKCVCVVMHTYDAFVTADAWNVSVHVCTVCGAEHFQELIPASDEPEAAVKLDAER